MDSAIQALSSATRRRILAHLSKTSLTAGKMADKFDMSEPAVSKHLSILSNAGLVESDKKSLHIRYRLNKQNLFTGMNDFLVNFRPDGKPLKLESAELDKRKRSKRT